MVEITLIINNVAVKCPYIAKELIQGMLTASTMERLTARQILEDPWITVRARNIYVHVHKCIYNT